MVTLDTPPAPPAAADAESTSRSWRSRGGSPFSSVSPPALVTATAVLFGITIFFVPLIALVGQGVEYGEASIHPATASALIMVGYLMLRVADGINFQRPESAIPAFLIIAGVPLTFSIAAGIGFGVIGYVAAMAAQGRAREVHPLMWGLVPLFLAFFAADWLSANVF